MKNYVKVILMAAGIALFLWGTVDVGRWAAVGKDVWQHYSYGAAAGDLTGYHPGIGVIKVLLGAAAVIVASALRRE